jgi:CRP-like cAMP-binding protein
MANDAEVQQQIVEHLAGIPIFYRLTEDELIKIFGICNFKRLAQDEQLYKFGTPSDDLFILLDGQLVARAPTGQDIAYIPPIGLVGEMGVLTNEPRSADVYCMEEAMGFAITKADLVGLFLSDGSICRKMLLNLVKTLSQKLYDTNAEIQKLRDEQKRDVAPKDDIFLY